MFYAKVNTKKKSGLYLVTISIVTRLSGQQVGIVAAFASTARSLLLNIHVYRCSTDIN